MDITEKPRRPILRPLGIVALSLVLLFASGFVYSLTGWVWLGGVNLVLLIVGGLALIWLLVVLFVLVAGTVIGRSRR